MGKSNAQKCLEFAQSKLPSCKYWHELHNAMFGVGGEFSRLFKTPEERTEFSKTPEYAQIWAIINQLRDNSGEPPIEEFSGKMSLRLPKSLHAALAREAENEGVSLNQLIIVKLATELRSKIG